MSARGASLDHLEAKEEQLLEHGDLNLPRTADQHQLADGSPQRDASR
jgi:hypothetical protein